MKKRILYSTFFILAIPLSVFSQSHYIAFNDIGWDPDVIWMFKVVDDFNDKPLRNAKVELALAKGRRKYDKREKLKEKIHDKEISKSL